MVVPRFVIGFSGHRNLKNPELIRESIEGAFRLLEERAKAAGGTLEYYGSIAYGADTLSAEVARELGIPVHLILPKPIETHDRTGAVQVRRAFPLDFWDGDPATGGTFRQEDWDRAWAQIEHAREGTGGGTIRLANGSQTDPECYYDAGMQNMEACDAMITVWDGEAARGLGGTAEMVEIVRAIEKPMVVIDADSGEIRPERIEAFAAKPDPALEEVEKINQLGEGRCPESPSAPVVFDCLDDIANLAAKQFRSSLVRSIAFHGAATSIAAFAAIMPHGEPWSPWTLFGFAFVEMILVSWALYLSQIQAWRKNHQKWLRARFAAELVRGFRTAIGFLDPLSPQITRHTPQWRRFAVSLGLLTNREVDQSQSWSKRRDIYLNDRLNDQIGHFESRQKKASALVRWTQVVARWATWLAPFVVLSALVYKLYDALGNKTGAGHFSLSGLGKDTVFLFLPIFVPLIAGMATGVQAALDATRRTHRYKEVAERLRFASKGLSTVKTETGARNTIAGTEEILLDELIEWKLAEQQNAAH